MKLEKLGDSLWRTPNGTFRGRLRIRGRRTWRALASITVRDARAELAKLKSDHQRSLLGLCPDPFAPPAPEHTFRDLAQRYIDAGCPSTRRGSENAETEPYIRRLMEFFGTKPVRLVDVVSRNEYHTWRIARVTKGAGHRAVELELSALNTMLRWCVANIRGVQIDLSTLIAPRFRPEVRHCTASMVRSDEELHQLAAHLLEDRRTETAAWQLLFEALTGCRSGEILQLRLDAPVDQPGHVSDTTLAIHREKGGVFPWVLLEAIPGHAPLRSLIAAHRRWHAERHPTSPWYFPGRDPSQPSNPGRLAHALPEAAKTLGLPHRTTHGLRAYYVSTLRSLGVDDSEISKRLGHRSGVSLVERTYGEPRPGWYGARKQDFLPDPTGENPVPIAWQRWGETTHNIIPMAGAV